MKNEIEQTKLQIVDLKDSNKDLIRLLTSGNNSSKSVPPNEYKYNETNTQTTHKKLNFPNIKESQSTMKTITPKRKPNSESQVPKEREKSQSVSTIDDKNDNAYDNFVEAKKRHRRNKNIGTNSVSEAEEQVFISTFSSILDPYERQIKRSQNLYDNVPSDEGSIYDIDDSIAEEEVSDHETDSEQDVSESEDEELNLTHEMDRRLY
ncbi:hypothetical protein JTB14_033590 [Gonioctena quinquepunctata]|nr:hypothetical protein JTB14_033590 [Gonioctena quinquepunctata]